MDIHCQKVLNKHWPSVPIHPNVMNLTKKEVGDIKPEVICGGFPCQDLSVSGHRKGITEGTRSGLWFEYKRIINEFRPNWVIIENVRNLLSLGMEIVLRDLDEIGYNCEWQVISARDVGAPHLRERVWIVAWPKQREKLLKGFCYNEIYKSRENEKWGSRSIRLDPSENPHTDRVSGIISPNSDGLRLVQREGFSEEIHSGGDERLQRKKSKQPSLSEPLHRIDEISTSRTHSTRTGMGEYSSDTQGRGGSEEPQRALVLPSDGQACPERVNPSDEPSSHGNDFRFWPSFTSEEEKSEWWAKTTLSIRDWWKIKSGIRGMANGLPKDMDRSRAQRIKQLGNSIVPPIVTIIGELILFHEMMKDSETLNTTQEI